MKRSNEGFNSGPTGHDFTDNSNALGTNEPALGASYAPSKLKACMFVVSYESVISSKCFLQQVPEI
jgi:hypothetical protein